jgi:hypothetical protein
MNEEQGRAHQDRGLIHQTDDQPPATGRVGVSIAPPTSTVSTGNERSDRSCDFPTVRDIYYGKAGGACPQRRKVASYRPRKDGTGRVRLKRVERWQDCRVRRCLACNDQASFEQARLLLAGLDRLKASLYLVSTKASGVRGDERAHSYAKQIRSHGGHYLRLPQKTGDTLVVTSWVNANWAAWEIGQDVSELAALLRDVPAYSSKQGVLRGERVLVRPSKAWAGAVKQVEKDLAERTKKPTEKDPYPEAPSSTSPEQVVSGYDAFEQSFDPPDREPVEPELFSETDIRYARDELLGLDPWLPDPDVDPIDYQRHLKTWERCERPHPNLLKHLTCLDWSEAGDEQQDAA